jgi:dynactin-6
MSTSTKRQSILPRVQSGPKAPVNFSPSITIADSALLAGTHTINISSESVVHPRAKLDSANGRITIGRRCIVHERTSIGAASASPTPRESRDGVVIGDYVTVEIGAVIESGGTIISDGCQVGVGSRVGKGAKLGKVS